MARSAGCPQAGDRRQHLRHDGPQGAVRPRTAPGNDVPLLRLLAALVLLAIAQPAPAADRFAVTLGTYLALPPPGWDGHTPLAVTLFLHGAGADASEIADDAEIAAAFAQAKVLLVAPEGLNRGWAAEGSPRAGNRDEVAFLDAVLEDLARRFPLDPARIRIAGFSLGASAALDYACARGGRLAAVLTVSGVFWLPMPGACAGGPTNWLSIHGRADTTWPLAGRVVRQQFRQGDRDGALSIVRGSWQCQAPRPAPWPAPWLAGMDCEASSCAGGRVVQACLHPDGHAIEAAWIAAFHAWAEAIPAAPKP